MTAYWGIAAYSAYDMFSWYKYLSAIFSFFAPLGLLSGNFFLIAPFPDHCLLVPFGRVLCNNVNPCKTELFPSRVWTAFGHYNITRLSSITRISGASLDFTSRLYSGKYFKPLFGSTTVRVICCVDLQLHAADHQ